MLMEHIVKQLSGSYPYYGLSLYREILFLSDSFNGVHKVSKRGQNFTRLSIDSASHCYRKHYRLKVFSKERQPQNCKIQHNIMTKYAICVCYFDFNRLQSLWHYTNGGCSHFCLLSVVDPRSYSCDCPDGIMLDGDKQTETTTQNANG